MTRLAAAFVVVVLGCSNAGPVAAPGTASKAPAAVRADSIYFVLVDRFADGSRDAPGSVDPRDPSAWHGGDLPGLQARLDHIADLGFRRVWLSPVWSARTEPIGGHGAFHGYWTYDLRAVDGRFGTIDDLRDLGRAAARRGMSLVLDIVLNHVGYDAPLLRTHPEWFHHLGDIRNWDDFTEVETHDVHGLPDLDQSRPEVFEHLVEATAPWSQLPGVSGFRLDAVKHIGADFWLRYNDAIHRRAGPGFALLGELYDGDPTRLATALGQQGFDQLFDFPLYFALIDVFCKGADPRALAATIALDRLYGDPRALVTFVDNHDLPRLWSVCGGDEARVHDALLFQFASRGVPMLTYGTEVGLRGDGEPANRSDMVFPSAPTPTMALIRELLSARARHSSLTSASGFSARADEAGWVHLRIGDGEVTTILVAGRAGPLRHAVPGRVLARFGAVGIEDGQATVAASRVAVVVSETSAAALSAAIAGDVSVALSCPGHGGARVVGAGPELGHWSPLAAPRCAPEPARVRVPRGTTLAYKLATVDEAGTVQWEAGGNRYLHARGDIEVEISWRE